MTIVEFKNVTRIYKSSAHEQKVLDGVYLSLDDGQFIVISGLISAIKSMLGGLGSPTNGTIILDGKDISTITNNEFSD